MTSLFQFDGLDVEDDATTVALGADEAFESMLDAKLGSKQLFGDRADGAGADLERDLAGRAELGHFGLVFQAEIQRRQAGGGESQSASLDDRRRQRQPVRQAAASCWGARLDSSRSTVFIMTEGVVSAWSLTTVR